MQFASQFQETLPWHLSRTEEKRRREHLRRRWRARPGSGEGSCPRPLGERHGRFSPSRRPFALARFRHGPRGRGTRRSEPGRRAWRRRPCSCRTGPRDMPAYRPGQAAPRGLRKWIAAAASAVPETAMSAASASCAARRQSGHRNPPPAPGNTGIAPGDDRRTDATPAAEHVAIILAAGS